MRRHVLCLAVLMSALGLAKAQKVMPTKAYKLHAQKEQKSSYLPSTLIRLLPDQSLLVLVPQSDSLWSLKRVSAWSTDRPNEESLSFKSVVYTAEGQSGIEDLVVDPAGRYAVIRIKSFGGSLYDGTVRNRSASVILIDLQKFQIVSQQTTTDPLLAASDWSFAENGLLVTAASIKRTTVPAQLKHPWAYQSITDVYEAAALTLPTFTRSMTCHYERVIFGADATSQARSSIAKSKEDCSPLIAVADLRAGESLPGGQFPSLRYVDLARPCQFKSEGPEEKFGLYECLTGGGYFDDMILTTKTRNFVVLTLPEGKQVLTVPLAHHRRPIPAVLAHADDQTWLLILRDGIDLSAYKIP